MTIDEAIRHCLEVAAEKEDNARWKLTSTWRDECNQCAADHRQLAEWLTELKELREKVSGGDILKICELEKELAEAKRLLKLALEDMNDNEICYDINACNVCTESQCTQCDTFKWRYTDEALKLLGGNENG